MVYLQFPTLVLYPSSLAFYLFSSVTAIYFLRTLILYFQRRLYSDFYSIPGPPAPLWKRYTIGHNVFYQTLTRGALAVNEQINIWREQYGPTFALRGFFGNFTIVITSEQGLRSMAVSNVNSFEKSLMLVQYLTPLLGTHSVFLAPSHQHARLRKVIAPAVQSDAINTISHIFNKHAKRLADRCEQLAESGKNITDAMSRVAFAVIFEACFGADVVTDSLMADMCDAYLTILAEPPLHMMKSVLMPTLLPFLGPMMFTWRRDLKKYIQDILMKLSREHRKKCKLGEGGDALLTLMLDKESKHSLTEQEMAETVQTFLLAGQATTALAACWTFYLLAKHPEWQQQILQEVNTWHDESDLQALEALPILDRFVRETLRLYPPVYSLHRRITKPVEIDGYKIPADSTVRVPVLAIQRNKDIWGKDADEFNPDRFLSDGERMRTRMFWCAFFYGTRGCVGQRFAIIELKTLVAHVLRRLELYIKPLEDPAPKIASGLNAPKNMKIYFRKR